jgi:hypothetical protein
MRTIGRRIGGRGAQRWRSGGAVMVLSTSQVRRRTAWYSAMHSALTEPVSQPRRP